MGQALMGSAPAPKESSRETGMVIDCFTQCRVMLRLLRRRRIQSRRSMFSLSTSTDVHMAPVILVDVEAQPSPLVHMCRLLDHHRFCHECCLPVSWRAPPTAMTLGFSLVSFSPSMLYYPGKFPWPLKTSLT